MMSCTSHFGRAFVFLILLVVFAMPRTVSASASDQLQQQNASTAVHEESEAPLDGAYMNPLAYQMEESKQESPAKRSSVSGAYSNLGFSRIDAAALARYIDVEKISEKEFYDLNFSMKIASVALTSDNDLLLRTVDNTYCTIKISDEYIQAMELTGVVEKGISLRMAADEKKTEPNAFSTLILIMLIVSFLIFIIWFCTMNKRTCEPDKITVGAKEKGKNGAVNPEKKVTFNEVQGIDELKPDLFRLVDSLKHPAKYKKLGARPTKGLILYGPPPARAKH